MLTQWDWILVAILNGSIVLYGLYLSGNVHSSTDWFLAGRKLPWWLVGLSMYATAIDTSDLVADSGGTYNLGISFFIMNWVGVIGGWALAGFFIAIPMYRAGMYTNAEYLEARFGPAARVLSALVQVQYRTSILAIIGGTVHLTLSVVCGWETLACWLAVVLIAILASVYTALGGLRSVAVTDSLQFLVMLAASLILWTLVWNEVGGWTGVEKKLAAYDEDVSIALLHAGHDNVERKSVTDLSPEEVNNRIARFGGEYLKDQNVIEQRTSGWLVAVAFIIMGVSYSVVNHTQTMRLFGARSEWDLKMSIFVAGIVLLLMTFFNLSVGIMGRALHPDQTLLPDGRQDTIYPLLVHELAPVGLKGIVVAGILAAALSTYDSIGATLSSLLTRDVYARFVNRKGSDFHYLRTGQIMTPLIIGGSFLYVPFLKGGMVQFFINISSVFVVPLLVLYVMGRFTGVHRRSGTIGLLVGAAYGVLRLIVEWTAWPLLPAFLMNQYGAYLYSMILTAGTMLLVSLLFGWETKHQFFHQEQDAWLRRSQEEAQQLQNVQGQGAGDRSTRLPAILAVLVLASGCVLSFWIFW